MKKIITLAITLILVLTTLVSCNVADAADLIPAPDNTASDNNVSETDISENLVSAPQLSGNVSTDTNTQPVEEETSVDEHKCEIIRATEYYHRYSCNRCENYESISHDETTMVALEKSEWFHIWNCEDCGYEYAERHNFRTAHTENAHYDVCIDCGYTATAENHIMFNDFHGFYHDIECEECRYSSERHIGVKYTVIDAISCQATCNDCGVTEVVEHDLNGFVCENCGYELGLFTCAVVEDIEYNRDENGINYYTIGLVVNNSYVYVDITSSEFRNWDFNEGDFVQIFHEGNDIYDICCLINGDIVNDYENFEQYVAEDTILPENTCFEDLVIDEITYSDDEVIITFESGRRTWFVNPPFVVYDLRDSSPHELYSGDAILSYNLLGNITYFVIIW